MSSGRRYGYRASPPTTGTQQKFSTRYIEIPTFTVAYLLKAKRAKDSARLVPATTHIVKGRVSLSLWLVRSCAGPAGPRPSNFDFEVPAADMYNAFSSPVLRKLPPSESDRCSDSRRPCQLGACE